MDRFKLPVILLFVILLSSCADDTGNKRPEDGGNNVPDKTLPNSDIVEGKVMVKLAKEPSQDICFNATRSGAEINTGLEGVDDILGSLGVKSMARIFPPAGRFEQRTREAGLHLWYIVEFDDKQPVTRAAAGLSESENIEIVEPVRRVVSSGRGNRMTPLDRSGSIYTGNATRSDMPFNDTHLNLQWNFNNTGGVDDAGKFITAGFAVGADIKLFDSWETTTGSSEVIVCVVDGGVDYLHEDLKDNIWINEGEIPGNNIDDDGNGYADDVYGYNFVDGEGRISPHSHGTHVAGTVSAVNNNGIGVAGIAGGNKALNRKGARIMSAQIFKHKAGSNDDVSTYDAGTAAAIKYGADNGAVISQNSWSYDTGSTHTPGAVKDAIEYFINYAGVDEHGTQTGPMKGGIVIFAAGNDNKQIPHYPAAEENVIAVAAMGADYKRAAYSNYGSWIDITAPGGDIEFPLPKVGPRGILSTLSGWTGSSTVYNKYYFMDGTSMAAPHVAGVAALIISEYGGAAKPGLTPELLKSRLLGASYNIDMYNAEYTGGLGAGCLNAALDNTSKIYSTPIKDVSYTTLAKQAGISLKQHFRDQQGAKLSYTASAVDPKDKKKSEICEVSIDEQQELLYITTLASGTTTVTVTASNGLVSKDNPFEVTCSNTGPATVLFPNPVKDALNIKHDGVYKDNGTVRVYSSSGAKVIDFTTKLDFPNTYRLKVDKLTPGTYTIIIEYNGGARIKSNFLKI